MIRVSIEVKCDVPECGASAFYDTFEIWRFDQEMPNPGLPRGWRRIDNAAVCPEHRVAIEPKSELAEAEG